MSNFMTEYQRQVTESLMIDGGVDPLAHCALGLTAEAGEVADLVKKSQYASKPGLDQFKMQAELGDVLWYLTSIAGQYGWTLEEVAASNILKLENRHPNRYDFSRLVKAGRMP